MLFIDELDPMRLYSSKRKIYSPIDPSNKRKGAAVMLLTKNSADSHTLMNMSYIYNPKVFEALYIDRNVNAIIDSGGIIDEDPDEAVNESYILEREDKDIDKVFNLFDEIMNSEEYAFNVNPTDDRFGNKFKLCPPEKFKSLTCPTCWDYATYQADYFERNISSIPFNTYFIYIEDNAGLPNHTFLVFKMGSKYYHFECCMKRHSCGIYKANSLNDIFNFVFKCVCKGETKFPYYAYEYNATDNKIYGLKPMEFIDDYIPKYGKKINFKYSGSYKVEKIDRDQFLTEAMQHVKKEKEIGVTVTCKTESVNDFRLMKEVFKEKRFLKWYKYFKARQRDIARHTECIAYPNTKSLAGDFIKKSLEKDKGIITNSYSDEYSIAIVASSGYEAIKCDEGAKWEQYAENELITYVILRSCKNCSRYLAGQVASILSGQFGEKEAKKVADNSTTWEEDQGKAALYTLYKFYKKEGQRGLIYLCKSGDLTPLANFAGRRFVRNIFNLYEAKLTAEEKKKLKPSDYGLPSKKKYPMPDEEHVRAAIRYFNKVNPSDEEELAKNIKRKIKQFDMEVEVGKNNRFSKYYNESVIDEGYIFSGKDIESNLDIWGESGHNILFVCGLSGGGKTTTALKTAHQNDANIVELDRIEHAKQFCEEDNDHYVRYDLNIIKKWWKKNKPSKDPLDMNNDEYIKYFYEVFDFIIKDMKAHPKEMYVIEGIQLIRVCKEHMSELVNEPFIIKGTSLLKSVSQRAKRDGIRGLIGPARDKVTLEDIITRIDWYLDQEYSLGCLRKAVKNSSKNESTGFEDNTEGNINLKADLVDLLETLSEKERNDIAFNGDYNVDHPAIVHRFTSRDDEGKLSGFLDLYHHSIKPFQSAITVAVSPNHRRQGVAEKLVHDLLTSAPDKDITRYVWHVDPMNTASVNLAKKCGFKNNGLRRYRKDLGIWEDEYEYNIPFRETAHVPLPTLNMLNEGAVTGDEYICNDDFFMFEGFISFFNGMDNQIISEAEKRYDNKLKKWLFKERLKNNKMVLMRYEEMKIMNPWIKRTYLKLPMYRKQNIFIDLSYYHALFLQHLTYKRDLAINMYWDFINRLLNSSEYKDFYKKITIYLPVWPEAWDTKTIDELIDYRKSINPISLIFRMIKKNPEELKKWGNKDILFVGQTGFFKVNFNNLKLRDTNKLKRFLEKLFNKEEIKDDIDDDGYGNADKDIDSTAAITAKVIDRIERKTGIQIDDITGGTENMDQPKDVRVLKPTGSSYTHLRIRSGPISLPSNGSQVDTSEDTINDRDKPSGLKNGVLIMSPTETDAAETFIQSSITKNRLFVKKGYYKP